MTQNPRDDDLALLDDEQEWSAFSRPSALIPGCWESNVVIEGMHCAACAGTIEDALQGVPGVQRAEVSAASRRARVVWRSETVRPSHWMAAVRDAGYQALPANDEFANERRRQESRTALWRMSVAGLCMMQVMMYAWPAYVARPGDLSAEMEQLLRWASWVLSLPVISFSCGPFFTAAWRDLAQRRISMDLPVALGMGLTFAVSTLGTFDPKGPFGHEVYFDSLTMFVFFLLTGRWLELRLRDRTAGALDALMNRLPESVLRRGDDGHFERVALRRLRVGDTVRVLPGEALPADGCVTLGQSSVEEALLTGESTPLRRGVGEQVIAGSHNLEAVLEVRVEKLGSDTRFAQIVALMQAASVDKPQLAVLADRLAKPFLLAVLLAATGALLWLWPQDPARAVMTAVAILVVTCPCALSLATPAAMLSCAGALARGGVLVRRLQAIEALSQTDMVVFDKTGTLTTDASAVGPVLTRADTTPEQVLQWAAALGSQSLHPVSRAVVRAVSIRLAGGTEFAPVEVSGVREIAGQGLQAEVHAAGGSRLLRLGSGTFCSAPSTASDTPMVHLADGQGWLASIALTEELRPQARACVQALRADGFAVQLLSGDSSAAAQRVADQVGIDQVQAGCSPQEKLEFLRAAQGQGRQVVMVGDGLNDGPVLAGAHVSFALHSGVPLAQAQADFVIMGERLGGIAQAVRQARSTMRVVRQNLVWAAAYNALCVPLAVVGALPAWLAGLGMAASSLLVVLNALRLTRPLPPLE